MYFGAFTRKLINDQINLPEEIASICKGRSLTLTIVPGPCIVCLEEERWAKIEDFIMKLPDQCHTSMQLRRFIFGKSYETFCSDEGKLEIPSYVASAMNFDDEVLIIGFNDRFVLWNKKGFGHWSRDAYITALIKDNRDVSDEEIKKQIPKNVEPLISMVMGDYSSPIDHRKHNLFLCHSAEDKAFVYRLAKDLTLKGITVWFEDCEMRPGDSLFEKIQFCIPESSFAVVLSDNTINSGWFNNEQKDALSNEFKTKGLSVFTILNQECEIPEALKIEDSVCMSAERYETEFPNLLGRFNL